MIDLAEKMPEPCCAEESSEPYYPNIHISKDEPIKLPDEGQMVVKFKVTSREESERDGKKRYSCTVQCRKISQVKGPKPKRVSAMDATSAILDSLRAELEEGDEM